MATVSRSIARLKGFGWLSVRQTRGTSRYTLRTPETVTEPVTVSGSVTVTESDTNTVTEPVTANSDRTGHTEETIRRNQRRNSSAGIEPRSAFPTAVPSLSGSATPTKRAKKESAYTSDDMDLATWMLAKIREVSPSFGSRTNLESWANQVRLIRTADKRTPSEIRSLFEWANADTFWRTNILSPDTLRKQWDKLEIKRGANGKANPIVQADDWQRSDQWRGVL